MCKPEKNGCATITNTLKLETMYTLKQKIDRGVSSIKVHGVLREGQSLEEFLRKAMSGNEPIQATAKVTYNDRKDGVLPQHDIRTDRFDLALMQTDKLHATQAAARRSADFGPTPEELAAAAAAEAAAGNKNGEA